jgi:lambda family phage minor tail protein L
LEGIEATTDGTSPQPKLTVANLGSISALCLAYDDLLQAKVSIHDTLARYLDARNFQGNPIADPSQEKLKVFYIDAKSTETDELLELLFQSMDLQGLMIPTRSCIRCAPGVSGTSTGPAMAATMPERAISTKTIIRLTILRWMNVTAR